MVNQDKINKIIEPLNRSKGNILICTGIFPPDIGGPASYAPAIVDALIRNNFGVSVITYSGSSKKSDADRVAVSRISRKWPKGFRHFLYFLNILKLAKNADTLFALNAVSAGIPAALAASFLKKGLVVKIVGDYAWEIAAGKGKTRFLIDDFQKTKKTGWIGILHKLQVWTCKKANRVIVPSEYLESIVRGWGVPASKINIIYNGTDFKPVELSKEEARKQIGVAGNIIFSAGRLEPWKGFKMLIKIMPRLLELNQFFRLVIAGSGTQRKQLEAVIKNMNLGRKVFLVGSKNRSELAVFMAASDIFILNTGYEGFSHQILEAMHAGTPVITTNVGGNKEVIKQGENGFMVRYNDEANLFEAIKTVWQSNEIKQKFIDNGRETIKNFTVDRMVEETIRIL